MKISEPGRFSGYRIRAIVVVAAEQRGRAIGRIRLQRIADASAENLRAFVEDSVIPGTVVALQSINLRKKGAQ